MEEEGTRCPVCGSDNPKSAYDTLRPETPIQSATWNDSIGQTNWICPDPFHEEASE